MKMKIDTLLKEVGFQPESAYWLQLDEKFRGEYQEFLNMQKSKNDTFTEKDIKEKDQKLYDDFYSHYDVEDMIKSEKEFKGEHKEIVPEITEAKEQSTVNNIQKEEVEKEKQSAVDSKQKEQKPPKIEQKTELKDETEQKPHVLEQKEEGLNFDDNGIATLTIKDQKKTKKETKVPDPETENTNMAEKIVKPEKEKDMKKEEKQPEEKVTEQSRSEETPEEIIERIKKENPEQPKVEEVGKVVEAQQITEVKTEADGLLSEVEVPPADEYPELTSFLKSNSKINSKELIKLGFPRDKWNEDEFEFEYGKYICRKTGPSDLMFNSWSIFTKTDTSV